MLLFTDGVVVMYTLSGGFFQFRSKEFDLISHKDKETKPIVIVITAFNKKKKNILYFICFYNLIGETSGWTHFIRASSNSLRLTWSLSLSVSSWYAVSCFFHCSTLAFASCKAATNLELLSCKVKSSASRFISQIDLKNTNTNTHLRQIQNYAPCLPPYGSWDRLESRFISCCFSELDLNFQSEFKKKKLKFLTKKKNCYLFKQKQQCFLDFRFH